MTEIDITDLLEQISQHTDAWNGWSTTPLTVLTMIASIVTILGLILIFYEYLKYRASKERQELIVKDLIRHLFINAAIMEVVRMKMAGNWEKMHPTEGVFSRFCVLDTDLQLDKIRVKDDSYTRLHSVSLTLRNYNIMSQLAEKHFNDPNFDPKEKERDLDELWTRTKRITEKLLDLGKYTKLRINKESVKQFVIDYYEEEKRKREEDLSAKELEELVKKELKIHPLPRLGDRAFYDKVFELSDIFDYCVKNRHHSIRVIPFTSGPYSTVSSHQ